MEKSEKWVSIIIPLKAENDYIRETLSYLQKIDYSNFEVIILPDEPFTTTPFRFEVKMIPTGPEGPGKKRDIGAANAKGEILAFLDDDTFPAPEWLKNAVRHFEDEKVAAVGGPAVTPPGDSALQKASGYVYSSLLGGGNYAYRYLPLAARLVDDYPTCNLLVRKAVFEKIGGFDTTFWPGEDTKLCLAITRDLGMQILYTPDAVVYHHRRPLLGPHLRQVRQYAMHRGYFVKRFPETSLRLSYFFPTMLCLGLFGGGLLAILWPPIRLWYLSGVVIYLLAALASAAAASRSLAQTPLVAAGIVVTQVVYGIRFVIGLTAKKLKEEKDAGE